MRLSLCGLAALREKNSVFAWKKKRPGATKISAFSARPAVKSLCVKRNSVFASAPSAQDPSAQICEKSQIAYPSGRTYVSLYTIRLIPINRSFRSKIPIIQRSSLPSAGQARPTYDSHTHLRWIKPGMTLNTVIPGFIPVYPRCKRGVSQLEILLSLRRSRLKAGNDV